jgi:hypothetical protein
MFVRFGVRNGRLVSLVESRRVRRQYVADLGSIEQEPSHAARLQPWLSAQHSPPPSGSPVCAVFGTDDQRF